MPHESLHIMPLLNMLPSLVRPLDSLSGQDLVLLSENARLQTITRINSLVASLAELPSPTDLVEFRAWTTAAEHVVAGLVQDRLNKRKAIQNLQEARLRAERAIGLWLISHINHTGGGDRRTSGSQAATPNRDLPEGITKSNSSRWQKLAQVPEIPFERWLTLSRDTGKDITTQGGLRLAKTLERERSRRERQAHPQGPATSLLDLAAAATKYSCIYADPPWRYDNVASNGAAANHYETLSLPQLVALPVRDLAAPDSHIHLWATATFLPHALHLLHSWGFAYKGMLTWCKPQMGTGNYWRSATEFLLLGVRGQCPFLDNSIPSWVVADRGRHSEKPESVRRLIERVSPGPYLELFARRRVPGWTVWGNEVEA
jgi:N6-adenosine-specific RNA methylase IME4